MTLYGEDFESFKPLKTFFDIIENFLRNFNKIYYSIFSFGNFIMFLVFLFLGVNLLVSAKDKEYTEKLHARNMEYLKKKGRVGTIIFLFLAIGFLFKGVPIVVLWCFSFVPTPYIFKVLKIGEYYQINTTLKDIYSYNVYESAFLFFICILSFTATLMFTIGLYLICFNKRILRSKLKSFNLFFMGLILGIIFGFAPGFWLLS